MQITADRLAGSMASVGRSGKSVSENMWQYYSDLNSRAPGVEKGMSFQELLFAVGGQAANVDPAEQLLADYQAWKAQQPVRRLPDSKGDTPENLAYLQEHFSGTLSLFQRLDAAETMVDMGMATKEQMLSYLGLGDLITINLDTAPTLVCTGTPESQWLTGDWCRFFGRVNVARDDTIDKLLDMLRRGQKNEEWLQEAFEQQVSQEVSAVLSQVAVPMML